MQCVDNCVIYVIYAMHIYAKKLRNYNMLQCSAIVHFSCVVILLTSQLAVCSRIIRDKCENGFWNFCNILSFLIHMNILMLGAKLYSNRLRVLLVR